jgi:hypothetical protein
VQIYWARKTGGDRMPSWLNGMSRRGVIRAALTGAAVGLTTGTAFRAAAQEKMSLKEAEYQDSPKDIRMCATCALFVPPKSCKVVEGDVSPNGWCKLFALAD